MPGTKTNERPGTRAVLRHCSVPAPKARQVLDLIRGEDVDRAAQILGATQRQAAVPIAKVLASAVANAVHNDGQDPEDLYVSACFADEAATLKRWRARARGRASRIYKRSSHVTVIVSRMDDERLARRRSERDATQARRSRRVAESRRRADLSGRLTRRRASQAEEARRQAEAEEAAEVLDIDLTEADAEAELEAVDAVDVLDAEAEAEAEAAEDAAEPQDAELGAEGADEESES